MINRETLPRVCTVLFVGGTRDGRLEKMERERLSTFYTLPVMDGNVLRGAQPAIISDEVYRLDSVGKGENVLILYIEEHLQPEYAHLRVIEWFLEREGK